MPKVSGAWTTFAESDTYSTGDANRISLGLKNVNSVAEMLAITLDRRKGNYDAAGADAEPRPLFCAVRTGTGLDATVTIYWLKNEPGTEDTELTDWEVYTPTAADPFQGFFNPATGLDADGNPITNGTGTKGHYYIAEGAGTYNSETYAQYDKTVYDGAEWKKVGGGSAVADWATMTNKPTEFTPVAHNHTIAEVTGLQTELNNKLNSGMVTGDVAAAQDTKVPNVLAVKNYTYSKEAVDTKLTQLGAYGIKFSWATATEQSTQTGMNLYDQGVRNDLAGRPVYQWNGTAWAFHFDLDDDNIGIASVSGLQTKLNELDATDADLDERVTTLESETGSLSDLTTTDKTNLVAAINEVNAKPTGDTAIKVPQTLTDAAPTVFNVALGYNAVWTMAASRTLNLTNLADGEAFTIKILNTNGLTLTFGTTYTHRVNGKSGNQATLVLPSGATSTVTLAGLRVGTEIRWTLGNY